MNLVWLLLTLIVVIADLAGPARGDSFTLGPASPTVLQPNGPLLSDILSSAPTGPPTVNITNALGLSATDIVTAISYGQDALPSQATGNWMQQFGTLIFSLSMNALPFNQVPFGGRLTVGAGIRPPQPPPFASVFSEGLGTESASDLFAVTSGIDFNRATLGTHRQLFDGNGAADVLYGLPAAPQLGLIELPLWSNPLGSDEIKGFDPLTPGINPGQLPPGTQVFFALGFGSTSLGSIPSPQGANPRGVPNVTNGPEDIYFAFLGQPNTVQVFLHGETYGLSPMTFQPGIGNIPGDMIDGLAMFFPSTNPLQTGVVPTPLDMTVVYTLARYSALTFTPRLTEGDLVVAQVGIQILPAPSQPGAVIIPAEDLGVLSAKTAPEDNVDAVTTTGFPRYFVLGPNSPSLAINGGPIPADAASILTQPLAVVGPAPLPQVAATSAALGLMPGDVIDGLSLGSDNLTTIAPISFSVDGNASGSPPYWGRQFVPDVRSEASAYEAAGDIFLGANLGAGVPGASPNADYPTSQLTDGNGLPDPIFAPQPNFFALPPGTPTTPIFGMGLQEGMLTIGAAAVDDITAVDGGIISIGPGTTIYFSLAPGSPTLAALGASPADVLQTQLGGPPNVFRTASSLNLSAGDDIDALLVDLSTNRIGFSLSPKSALVTSGLGAAPSPGDILVHPAFSLPGALAQVPAGAGLLDLHTSAENLDLMARRTTPTDDVNGIAFVSNLTLPPVAPGFPPVAFVPLPSFPANPPAMPAHTPVMLPPFPSPPFTPQPAPTPPTPVETPQGPPTPGSNPTPPTPPNPPPTPQPPAATPTGVPTPPSPPTPSGGNPTPPTPPQIPSPPAHTPKLPTPPGLPG